MRTLRLSCVVEASFFSLVVWLVVFVLFLVVSTTSSVLNSGDRREWMLYGMVAGIVLFEKNKDKIRRLHIANSSQRYEFRIS